VGGIKVSSKGNFSKTEKGHQYFKHFSNISFFYIMTVMGLDKYRHIIINSYKPRRHFAVFSGPIFHSFTGFGYDIVWRSSNPFGRKIEVRKVVD